MPGDSWAVILNSSRCWFNYRHTSNALLAYRILRKNGFPRERILLLLADDIASSEKNPIANSVFHRQNQSPNLFDATTEAAFKGKSVNAVAFRQLLLGENTWHPTSKRLNSGPDSRVLLVMTGHGGKNFFKFQNFEEMEATELAEIFDQMKARKRFKELLLLVDTCQASTMAEFVTTPGVLVVASSGVDEPSFSDLPNSMIQLPAVDRLSRFLHEFQNRQKSAYTFEQARAFLRGKNLLSTAQFFTNDNTISMMEVKMSKFFTPATGYLGSPVEFTTMGPTVSIQSLELQPLKPLVSWLPIVVLVALLVIRRINFLL